MRYTRTPRIDETVWEASIYSVDYEGDPNCEMCATFDNEKEAQEWAKEHNVFNGYFKVKDATKEYAYFMTHWGKWGK